MKTLSVNELETVAGGIHPGALPAIIIYIPPIVTKLADEAAAAE